MVGLQAANLGGFVDAWHRRHPQVLDRERWLLLDEVQVVAGWERFARRMLDTPGIRLVLTGSSARMLGREIATSMRGRALTTELLPFSFPEALRHAGIESGAGSTRDRALVGNALDRYLVVGGFPEVQRLDPELRARVLRDYVDVALMRDVIDRHGVTNVPALRSLTRRLLGAPAGKFSVHRFHNDLRATGLAASKDSVHEWSGHLEDACFVFFVPVYTESEAVRRSNPRKAYPVDPALAPGRGGIGHRLETIVYLELRRRLREVAWVSNADGSEVDFVATDLAGERELIQVCAGFDEPDTLKREVRGLQSAMHELGIGEGTIVTLRDERVGELPAGIRVVGAAGWLV